VGELLRTVSSRELTEWRALYRLEPFGTVRDDWRTGQLCSVLANLQRDPKKRPQPWTPAEFMPEPIGGRRKAKQTISEMKAVLRLFSGGKP